MSVTVEMNFNLKRINLDFSKELNKAGQVIKKDHYQRLEIGKGVDGSKMKALSPNTIAAKGNNKILVETGKMRHLVVDKANKTKQVVEIHPGEKRLYKGTNVTQSDVGGFHQEGTSSYTITPKKAKKLSFKTAGGWVHTNKVNHPGLPKREWFGISKDAEKQCINLMEERIERELRRA